ncbi:hypothetical protein NQ317_018268 [Molorchus minor]|uniref:Uncharacterized protein n=1 Tax=Molorchus minor TaxID=1323400 RepID=A0ABQ9K5V7_9CUCU|nr:hypothetical protein NQ317_018268 [Molorchus minor]
MRRVSKKSTRKIEKTILDNFSNIISQNEKLRIKSSVNLLRHLAENKNEGNENEINYALGRLIRGLGSSTPSARAGFYTVLVALINLSDLTVENIFELLNKQLHKGGGNTKGENADISIGQILACGAILKSELTKKILDLLLKASKERIYLNLVAYTFIVNKILEKLVREKLFVLKTIPRLTAVKHPVYDMIGKVLAKSEHLPVFLMETDKILHRPNRNKHLIVINLFSIILQNLEDKSIVPMILTRNFIQQTLNYFKMTGGKNKDAEFQQYMQTFFESLLKALSPEEVNLKIKISVLKKLLFYPGTFIFEKVTRSKIIQHITLRLDKEGIKKLAMVYRGVVDGS